MATGYANPVSTADAVRPLVANKNSPVWEKLDRADKFESAGVQHDMAVSTIRDTNRDADQARDGDVAGEERRAPANHASLVDDPVALA